MSDKSRSKQNRKTQPEPDDPKILAVKEFAERLGSIEQAKYALEMLGELRKAA